MTHLKSLNFVDWKDAHYEGGAIKIGAGVLGSEALAFAAEHDSTVIVGNGPSVGVAGGYIQGGGQSQLSSKFGLAADNALEYELVDASGKLLVANRETNADLYWALSGGGGGTYGVVLSVTVKAIPNVPTAFAMLEYGSSGVEQKNYLQAIEAFVAHALAYSKLGCRVDWIVSYPGIQVPVCSPGQTAEQVEQMIEPYLKELDALAIQYKKQVIPFPRYSDFHATGFAVMEKGQAALMQGGSWFIPRSRLENMDKKTSAEFMEALQKILDAGAIVMLLAMNPSLDVAGAVENAVHPGWRDLGLDLVTGL